MFKILKNFMCCLGVHDWSFLKTSDLGQVRECLGCCTKQIYKHSMWLTANSLDIEYKVYDMQINYPNLFEGIEALLKLKFLQVQDLSSFCENNSCCELITENENIYSEGIDYFNTNIKNFLHNQNKHFKVNMDIKLNNTLLLCYGLWISSYQEIESTYRHTKRVGFTIQYDYVTEII